MVQAPVMGFVEVMMSLLMYAGLAVPFGLPPGPEDPFLAQIAPDQPVFYASWAGSVDPDLLSKNQTERLLAEPEIREMLAEVQSEDRAAAALAPKKAAAAPVPTALRRLRRLRCLSFCMSYAPR